MCFKKLLFYFRLLTASEYNKYKIYHKFLGINFGENVRITHFPHFGSEPYLIEIGSKVTITRGVCFVNHDGGVGLFRDEYPGLNVYGKIVIGNNVFIGINSTIMPNVRIGNNVIIGAGSIVNKDIPDNVVVAGIPAKIIKSIEQYKDSILQKAIFITTKNNAKKKELILMHFNS